ncbi:hypothetical protein GCM10011313_21800 [Mycetocola zhadangensis]|nr:hypothetical protein GCM10011313_21800 [Mycetocola zhadangensis]
MYFAANGVAGIAGDVVVVSPHGRGLVDQGNVFDLRAVPPLGVPYRFEAGANCATFCLKPVLKLAVLLLCGSLSRVAHLLAQSGDSLSELRCHGDRDAQRVVKRFAYSVCFFGHVGPLIPSVTATLAWRDWRFGLTRLRLVR